LTDKIGADEGVEARVGFESKPHHHALVVDCGGARAPRSKLASAAEQGNRPRQIKYLELAVAATDEPVKRAMVVSGISDDAPEALIATGSVPRLGRVPGPGASKKTNFCADAVRVSALIKSRQQVVTQQFSGEEHAGSA